MKLRKHKFGSSNLSVSELCLSTSNFARYADHAESFAILDKFREAGGNFIQTSGICPGINLGDGFLGMPEEVLGRWLSERKVDRDSVVIATRIALTRPIIGGVQSYADLVRRCMEDSIRRIGCGHLDLFVVEWSDAIHPVAESVAVFEGLVDSGDVRHVVPANFAPARIHELLAASRHEPRAVAGLQVDYSLAVRSGFEGGVAKLAADNGLSVVSRSPLAGGLLAARRYADGASPLRTHGSAELHAAFAVNGIWPVLAAVARMRRRSPAEVALAWVLSHPQITSVLVSVRSVEQLRELLRGTELNLSEHNLARLGVSARRRRTAPANDLGFDAGFTATPVAAFE